MRRTSFAVALTLLVGLLAVGCVNNQNKVMQRDAKLQENKGFSPDFVSYADDMNVIVTDMKARYVGDFYQVQLEFMNSKMADVTHAVYQIEWLGADGFVLQTTSWKPLMVTGNQKVRVLEMSGVPRVEKFKLTIAAKE